MNQKYNTNIIRYSKFATILFIIMVAVADIFGWVISQYIYYCWTDQRGQGALILLTAVFYLGTIGAYGILYNVYKLLSNMSKDIVFDKANTKRMFNICASLVAIAVICIPGTYSWFGCAFLSIIALFMALIVMCVKVVFDKAIDMKNDLDLTI